MIRKTVFLLVVVFVVLSGCIDRPAEKGSIQFASAPAGAEVYLDQEFRGSTPTTVTGIAPGDHALEFRYTGYESWSAVMTVSPGANNVFAALRPKSETAGPVPVILVTPETTTPPVSVTMVAARESMVIGDSIQFSGTATGCSQVLLTIYGPGSFSKGMELPLPNVNPSGTWTYVWNPGSAIQAGTYTMVASDPFRTVSQRVSFTVIGGGQVSITSNSYAAAKGDTLRFSGLCTTGSQNVQLVLYGPGQYAGGVTLGTFSVMADKNWNFRYTLDSTMPTGIYTMYVYDVPKTTSGTVQFTVGYAS
jgi:hypothetical protein